MKILTGIVIALLASIPLSADAQGIFMCHANLRGSDVVPPTGSSGVAQFDAMFAACAGCYDCEHGAPVDSLAIIMPYQALTGPPTGSVISVGQPGSNGDAIHVITTETFTSMDTLYIRIAAQDCALLEHSACYVTIATVAYPDGEIRGQLTCGVSPTITRSWGMVRTLFR